MGHALEVVVLNEFVQIHAQALESNQQVLPEHHVVLHSDDVVLVMLVVVVEVLQNPELHSGLILELLLVPDDLDGHRLLGLVVETLDSLAKTTLSEEV